ncbi:hypothetical protein MJL27_27140, partial [Salmonella enterica subsp. enterica serovar Anatum]|nr:hypothetical protein [Salmonella enterica subsp. enterica serovar Anatum]
RVLGRMFDGIQYRGYGQEIVETLAEYSGVPVWNGLTDEYHPTDDKGRDRLNETYQKVISLPSRVKSLKDLSDSLKTLIGLEREA